MSRKVLSLTKTKGIKRNPSALILQIKNNVPNITVKNYQRKACHPIDMFAPIYDIISDEECIYIYIYIYIVQKQN